MKKTLASLASASLVVALGLSIVAPVGAQTTGTYGSSITSSSTTGTTNGASNSVNSTTNTGNTTSGTNDTSGTMSSSSTTPGLPNTGAGGDAAMNYAILLSTGLVVIGGSVLLARRLAA